MAKLTLNISASHARRLALAFGYLDEATNGTEESFLREKVVKYLQDVAEGFEVEKAKREIVAPTKIEVT